MKVIIEVKKGNKIPVDIFKDDEADTWVAKNDEIGLTAEADTFSALHSKVIDLVPVLLAKK